MSTDLRTTSDAETRQRPRYHSRLWVVMTSGRGFRARDWIPGAISLFAIGILWVLTHRYEPEGTVRGFFDDLPMLAIMWSLYMGTMLPDIGSTLEPLLATGVRRSDIVIGRFLRPALIYFVVVLGSVGILALGVTVFANVKILPELTRLHPTVGLSAWLILTVSVAGFESIAATVLIASLSGKINDRGKPDEFSEDVNRLGNPVWIVVGLICFGWLVNYLTHNPPSVISWAACPVLNGSEGDQAIFAQMELPGNPDMMNLHTHIIASFVPVMVLSSLAATALFLFLAVRNLESGGRRRRRAN
jgi:hypothetical protein